MRTIRLQLVLVFLLTLVLAACGTSDTAADDADARMAAEHAGDAPAATPAASTPPAADVTAERVAYATRDGNAVEGYLARPASGEPTAALIVIHEWWGLNENIEAVTRRLAAEGYLALAVDLYGGEVASEPKAAQALMGEVAADAAHANLRQARDFLAERSARVGVIGWCFGGGWSLQTAVMLGDGIDAAVMYYGRVITDPQALAGLTAPLQGHFGGQDQGIPVAEVRAMEAALEAAAKPAQIYVYDGAGHAFANPSGTRYDAAAAELAWSRTTAFFAEHLGAS